MNNLFNNQPTNLNLPNSSISYYPNFLNTLEAIEYYNYFKENTPWQQDTIKLFGKEHLQPRLTALYGNNEKAYSYSSVTMQPLTFSPELLKIKTALEKIALCSFTSCLLNYYRDGSDSNGWHADNEKELGKNPIIASLSLGAERYFHLRHNKLKEERRKILLTSGSLLLMQGETQHFWKHQIPKTKKLIAPRINLTFRIIN